MQENLYKKIKNGVYTVARIGLGIGIVSFVLATGVFAKEGTTIDDKINGEPDTTKISDEIKEEPEYLKGINNKIEVIEKEPKSLEYISNEINENFQENLANHFEIGEWSGYKETTNGIDNYIIKGLGIFSKCEIKSDNPPDISTIANYAISKGFDGAVSALKYGPLDRDFCIKSRENKGNGVWIVYYKKNEKDTKSSTQNKEE